MTTTLPTLPSSPALEPSAVWSPPEWTEQDRQELARLLEEEKNLPADAPRALLSVRLSVLTEETTSPVRQELDLRREALRRQMRVVGLAIDLNVSATKVPPWKRAELGNWLNNRVPEFDVILFWKVDRFVRNILDLHVMIEWCKEWQKDLISLKDPIDLHSEMGQIMATLTAGIARIEATNIKLRISSLWEYQKKSLSARHMIGKPIFGYEVTGEGGNKQLTINAFAHRVLHWARKMLLRGKSRGYCVHMWNRAGVPTGSKRRETVWQSSTFWSLMTNPALMGYRVTRKGLTKSTQPSVIVRDENGEPIKVAEGIFTPEEFQDIQAALNDTRKPPINRTKKQESRFIGVLECGYCHRTPYKHKRRDRAPLRCRSNEGKAREPQCSGVRAESADEVYAHITKAAFEKIGHLPVEYRTYKRGKDVKARVDNIEAALDSYLKGLEPGGVYAIGGYVQQKAEKKVAELNAELTRIDPEETKDRWVYERQGDETYASRWENGGVAKMEKDLLRSGVKFIIYDSEHMDMILPGNMKKLQASLAIKEDAFKGK
ncbi:recombinase family protein [Streptomyces sp. Tu6071]|uniref:recombinase family protein n=1 Tax=Streptomyces sp. Tu6071 TaxID=355249 RepID=UPI0009981ADD|nr:recombinase family protein [Streptomyces sp. Tu6071]